MVSHACAYTCMHVHTPVPIHMQTYAYTAGTYKKEKERQIQTSALQKKRKRIQTSVIRLCEEAPPWMDHLQFDFSDSWVSRTIGSMDDRRNCSSSGSSSTCQMHLLGSRAAPPRVKHFRNPTPQVSTGRRAAKWSQLLCTSDLLESTARLRRASDDNTPLTITRLWKQQLTAASVCLHPQMPARRQAMAAV